MKPIKMFGLAALAALMAMAFVGASSAMAGPTSLCSNDVEEVARQNSPCTAVSHVHETSVGKGKLLAGSITVECDVLFLSTSVGGLGASPLIIEGNFTYSNCGSCSATEENGPSTIEVLRTGHETSNVTGEGLVHVNCSGINCRYIGEGLVGTGKGPLLSTEANGEVSIQEAETEKESGFFCPATSKLDLKTTPLSATYINGELHYCVKYEHNTNGRYKDSKCTEEVKEGPYDLVVGPPGLKVGEMVCVHLNVTNTGLWENIKNYSECEKDAAELSKSLYELAEIVLVQ